MPSEQSVATIGPGYGAASELSFLSDDNFYEFGTLILSPDAIFTEFTRTGGAPPFGEYVYTRFVERSEQIGKWVADGHTLILLVASPASWQFTHVDGRARYAQEHSLYEISVLKDLSFQAATGVRMDYVGPLGGEGLVKPHLPLLRYQAIISNTDVVPLLQVRRSTGGQSQLVGCLHQYGRGRVFCMPMLAGNGSQHAAYTVALSNLPTALLKQAVDLPEWIYSFCSEEELRCKSVIEGLNREIEERKALVVEEETSLANSKSLKTLLAGSGEPFKDSVKAALQELGLQCVDGPHPRADLLAFDGKRVMAIEAKGLDGPVREKNFRQVQSWKAEVDLALSIDPDEIQEHDNPDLARYLDLLRKLGVTTKPTHDCKGLMAIGTFRKTPLNERNSPDFPENVSRLLVPSNVCGVTGLQLLGLVLLARRQPVLKEKAVAALFDTAGLLSVATDWREFLNQI